MSTNSKKGSEVSALISRFESKAESTTPPGHKSRSWRKTRSVSPRSFDGGRAVNPVQDTTRASRGTQTCTSICTPTSHTCKTFDHEPRLSSSLEASSVGAESANKSTSRLKPTSKNSNTHSAQPEAVKVHTKSRDTSDSTSIPEEGFMAPYCTEGLTKMDSASDNGDSADMPDDAAAAYVNPTKMWRGRTDLKVYFIESDLEVLKRWMVDRSPMTPEVILAWAGEWNSELAKAIPRFARVDSPDSADIRIAFGRGGVCWSKVGTDANSVPPNQPTMNFTFGENYPLDFQRYLVIHEFGHVLGLQHEHQRSDFWNVASKFLDPAKMQNDPRMRFTNFIRDIWELNSEEGEKMSKYDPDSIMHYWFDVKWLRSKYSKYCNKKNILKSTNLKPKEMEVLLGILKNSTYAERPSETDLLFLKKHYSKRVSTDYALEISQHSVEKSGPASRLHGREQELAGPITDEGKLEMVLQKMDEFVDKRRLCLLRLFFYLLPGVYDSDVEKAKYLCEFLDVLKQVYSSNVAHVLQYVLQLIGIHESSVLGASDDELKSFEESKKLAYPSLIISVCLDLQSTDFDRLKSYLCCPTVLNCNSTKFTSCDALFLELHHQEKISCEKLESIARELRGIGREDIAHRVQHFIHSGKFKRFVESPVSKQVSVEPVQKTSFEGKRESTDYAPEISQHSAQRSGPASRHCHECSSEQLSYLELLRKQLESTVKIRSVDWDCIVTFTQGAVVDYICSFSTASSPDFKHLRYHLESLRREERLIGDPALFEWALKKVDEKASEQLNKSSQTKALFCEDTIYHASLCCLAVNNTSSNSCQEFFSDRNKTRGHSFSQVSLSVTDAERYLIAKQRESTYYIAFQGRTDIHEWHDLYTSFKEGITVQAKGISVQFIVDLLADPKNRVVLTGFCFGGMLASYITTKLWKYPSLGWKHLQESLVCITFAQPLLPVPELGSFVRDFPEIAKSIHSIHYEQDKIPLVISLLDQKNSCLLVRESSSEPGLHMSVHEEPGTAFDDPLTLKLIEELGNLMKSQEMQDGVDHQEELKEALGCISSVHTSLERSFFDCFTHYSLCTKHNKAGLIFSELPSQEVRDKTSRFTLGDMNALLESYDKHSMQVYFNRLLHGYLEKAQQYTIPSSHDLPRPLQLAQPKLTKIEMSEGTSTLSLTISGENLWFCTKIKVNRNIEPELDFSATNSGTCIKVSHSNIENSTLDEIKNGKQLEVDVYSLFSDSVLQTIVPLTLKEDAQAVRQHHIEELMPSQLIELIYLSALLQRDPDGHFGLTKKFTVVKNFTNKAQNIVPLESIRTAINSTNTFVSRTSAAVVLDHHSNLPFSEELYELACANSSKKDFSKQSSSIEVPPRESTFGSQRRGSRILSRQISQGRRDDSLGVTSIGFIFPQCFPASPLDELERARTELEELVKDDCSHPEDVIFEDKSAVARIVADLRYECLSICKALLGEYFERQKILVQHGALPKLHDLTEERKLELRSKGKFDETSFILESSLFTILVDQPYAAEVKYTFLLESRIAKLCEERKVKEDDPLDTLKLVSTWKEIFKGSPLSLIVDSHVPMVACWLKWGLLVNNLRKEINMYFPPAIGVVGLVNSGKTKLVQTLFGIKVSSGTTEKTRTTIPFIYNLSDTVEDMDIVDFPGVDDIDESVKDVAELLLTLAQVIIYVVDYRRVDSKDSKKWLDIVQSKGVPMLLCLTHADKFYAEHISSDGCHPEELMIRSKVDKKLKHIKFGRLKIPQSVSVMFCTISQDRDSIFKHQENREKLAKSGINTPKDIGEWVATTFEKRLGNSNLAIKLRDFFKNSECVL